MATARTVRFADEIERTESKFSGRITMIDTIDVSSLSGAFDKSVSLTLTCDGPEEDDAVPSLKENISVRIDHDQRYFNCCQINFGRKFGTKGSGFGQLQDATDIIALGNGHILVSDMVNSKLQVFNDKGSPTVAYVLDELIEPRGVVVTPEGHIAATSKTIKAVTVFSPDGCLVSTFGQNIFVRPSGIAMDSKGNYIVTDVVTDKVSLMDKNGHFIQHIGKEESFKQPRYVTVSQKGDIIVSDSGNNCLKVFDSQGHFIQQIGKFGKQDGCLKIPYATTTDIFGNILVSDHYNDRISVFSASGRFLRHIVTSAHGLRHPQGISLSSEMVLYVSHGGLKANQVAAFELKFDEIPCNIETTI